MSPARMAAGAALVTIALGAAGCASPTSTGTAASTASSGAGAYPNLNVPLTPATAQLTPEDRTATADALRTRREGLAPAGTSVSSAAQLRQIGSTHSRDALGRIGAE